MTLKTKKNALFPNGEERQIELAINPCTTHCCLKLELRGHGGGGLTVDQVTGVLGEFLKMIHEEGLETFYPCPSPDRVH